MEVARSYARTRATRRSQGQLISDNDLWIGATALAYNLTLVCNDRHFLRIPDLKFSQLG